MKLHITLFVIAACLIPFQSQAEDVPPADGNWSMMIDVSTYSAYDGKSDAIHIKPFVIWIWNKAVFKEPQLYSSSSYRSEIFKIVFRCNTHDATVLRDVRYAADGSIVGDAAVADKDAKYFDVNSKSKVDPHQAVVREIALVDYEAACLKGD